MRNRRAVPVLSWIASLSWALLFASAGAAEVRDLTSDYFLRTWRMEDGLPDRSVTAIAQTSDGYIWAGTRRGLARTDGVRFVTWTAENGLETPEVSALAAGQNRTLWIALQRGGLAKYDQGAVRMLVTGATGKWGRIHRLVALANPESVFIAAENGCFLRTASGITTIAERRQVGEVHALCTDASGVLWLGTSKGVWHYAHGKLEAAAPQGVAVHSIAAAPDGTIRVASEASGFLEMRGPSGTPKRIWPVSQVETFCITKSGEVWLSTVKGALERLSPEARSSGVLETGAESVNQMLEDREGNLWLACEGAGLIAIRQRLLKVVRPDASSSAQSCTEAASGELWFAGRNGQVYRVSNGVVEQQSFTSHPGIFVEALLATHEGGIWLATRFDGLLYWTGRSPVLQPRGSATAISGLFEDRAGRIWVASARDGVLYWDRSGWKAVNSPEGGLFREPSCFAEDAEGRIWIGTRQGLLAEWREGSVQSHRSEPLLRDSRIHALYADVEGNLWIGTEHGLILRKDGRFGAVTAREGLKSDDIQHILEDFRGNLWLASKFGISRVSKAAVVECALQKRPSIQPAEFPREEGFTLVETANPVQPGAWRTGEGRLCFATRQGLAVIDLVRAAAFDVPMAAMVEEIRTDSRPVTGQIDPTRPVPIAAGYQHLTLRFTGLSFVAPERTQFRYRMSGIDLDWVAAGQNRTASYGKLPAGQYRFEVQARNKDGSWPGSGAIALLDIAPRYWETSWFRGLMLATAALIGVLFWLQHAARQRGISAVRQQITRDLHDDLGSNLGSIALLSEALQRPAPRGNQEELLREINRIARQTLDSMRDTLWFVDPGRDSARDLVAHLRHLAESMLRNTPHGFHARDPIETLPVPLEVKRAVVLIFKEALYNAVRHAQATRIDVSVALERRCFSFEILDDGRGFEPSADTGRYGLASMRQRADKTGAKLQIQSQPGKGTRVRLAVNLVDG